MSSEGLYEHLCRVVQDGRNAAPDDTTGIVADDGYERIVSALRPLTEPVQAWLDDTYQHETPWDEIAALLAFIKPRRITV